VLHELRRLGFSTHACRKELENCDHPERDAQFRYIEARARSYLRRGLPVVSVDSKKKELIGRFKNAGVEWHARGQAPLVDTHDFADDAVGHALPRGVYDVGRNEGWVSVGLDHDTAEFAIHSLLLWWHEMGQPAHPRAERLLITADAGKPNCPGSQLWRWYLQQLSNETGLTLEVLHYPPGTSKWNKVEHRLFSFVSKNWRGRPLESYRIIVSLIGHTTTCTGLQVRAKLDRHRYPTGQRVPKAELASEHLEPHKFHPAWNFTVRPAPLGQRAPHPPLPARPRTHKAPHRSRHSRKRDRAGEEQQVLQI
jgi:hypothetical protein